MEKIAWVFLLVMIGAVIGYCLCGILTANDRTHDPEEDAR